MKPENIGSHLFMALAYSTRILVGELTKSKGVFVRAGRRCEVALGGSVGSANQCGWNERREVLVSGARGGHVRAPSRR